MSTPQEAPVRDVRLRVEGRRIVDAKGQPVRLCGIYTRAEWLSSEEEVKWFKQWGVNFVRILLTYDKEYWQVVGDGQVDVQKRCILREENLAQMDRKCGWLAKHGIYYIIEVPWKWYGIDQSFPQPQLLREQVTRMYGQLAHRYREQDYLIGYAMFSEIYVAPWLYDTYKDLCTAIVDAVRTQDPGRICSVTGVQTSGVDSFKDATRVEREGLIYDFHYYWVKSFTHYRDYYGDMRYPGRVPHGYSATSFYQDRAFHEKKIGEALAFSRKWNVPLWCGEYGAFGDAPDGGTKRWILDVRQILEREGIPWILWTWRPGLKDVPDFWKQMWQGEPDLRATFSPHGGRYIEPVKVRIETWVKGGQIHYTSDGTEPTRHSHKYTSPFTVTEDTVVKARVFAEGLENAPVDTAVFVMKARKADTPTGPLENGLQCEVFDGAWKKLNEVDLKSMTAVESRVCANLESGSAGQTLRFTGWIEIAEDGRYFFYPESYGAYEVFIGEQLVNRHYATKYEWNLVSPGIIVLEKGLHPITVIHSQPQETIAGCTLRIQKDEEPVGFPFPVEDSMFYRKRVQSTLSKN